MLKKPIPSVERLVILQPKDYYSYSQRNGCLGARGCDEGGEGNHHFQQRRDASAHTTWD